MFTKPLILAILAACGVSPTKAATQPDREPPSKPAEEEGQHFCCDTVNADGTGDGCITIDKSHMAACDKVLYCGGTYVKEGGKVTCVD